MDFNTWTKEDFLAFDERRRIVFTPTEEEIQAQESAYIQQLIEKTKLLLAPYNIVLIGDETDFRALYTAYITNTPDMKEWLGDDLESKVDYYATEKNAMKDFCLFVISYEA